MSRIVQRFSTWLVSRLGTSLRGRSRSERSRRPGLEALEERTLLNAGDLDPTFGDGGKVITEFPGSGGQYGFSVALQPDGRIVAAGGSAGGFALARYNSDGSLDSSFGQNGTVTTSFGGNLENASSVALQSDGRIVAAGYTWPPGTLGARFALARYNTDGSLDTSFGTDGKVITSFGGAYSEAFSVAVQADGRIVAAGTGSSGDAPRFALARYNSDGSLDTSFGSGGLVTTSFGGSGDDLIQGMTLQPDGRIVAVGFATPVSGSATFALARYNSDGSLDTSFGSGGLVTTSFLGMFDRAQSVAVQPDGRIVAAGFTQVGYLDYNFALARYNSDGSLDGSFGTDGKVLTSFGGSYFDAEAYSVALQTDGRIVAAGFGYVGFTSQFGVARYNSDGSLDSTFGNSGLVTTSFGAGTAPRAGSVVVQPDGHILAGGYTDISGPTRFALARYEGTGFHFELAAPARVTAGEPFSVTLTAYDDDGNVATGYAGTVTLSSTDPLAPTLGSHTFTTADQGIFTFTGLQLFTAGPQSLFASDGVVSVQADLTVDPGMAVALLLSGPDHATVDVPFEVTATLYDAWGNVATGYQGTITFDSSDRDAVLPRDYPFREGDQGVHTFQVTLRTPGTQRVTLSDTLDPSLSGDLEVTL
jgi:uncharacterized delta-60 repeat protein